jgi:hypothetical protein
MILISHRGNIDGRLKSKENEPAYIDKAIFEGYDVEIDFWLIDDMLYLGHDKPQYNIDLKWLSGRINKLWIHCKNIESIVYLKSSNYNFNYFWHEEDTLTLTSHRYIWAYPGKQPIKESIAVMPEINNDNVNQCIGICSDHIKRYKKI